MFDNKDLLMATALHPHFKLGVVGFLNMNMKDDIKRAVLNEVMLKVRPADDNGGGGSQQPVDNDDPFRYMMDDDVVASQGRLEEDIEKTYDGWNRLRGNSTGGCLC